MNPDSNSKQQECQNENTVNSDLIRFSTADNADEAINHRQDKHDHIDPVESLTVIDVPGIHAENPFKIYTNLFKDPMGRSQGNGKLRLLRISVGNRGSDTGCRCHTELNSLRDFMGNQQGSGSAVCQYTHTSPNAEPAIKRLVTTERTFVAFVTRRFVEMSAMVIRRNNMVIRIAAVYKSTKRHPLLLPT